ncbi:YfhO family protein [Acidiphilium sp. AL]|uniref:YfhO family protein n=1 Tax=Acidiphilium sp. AL TaxID=2871704 RepID=UPI0021CB3663|nr:YfhO family protein [Acidiphilium sp. AL]MCU4158604.1 YfhO family protein [Acidiphilium sp. AL]
MSDPVTATEQAAIGQYRGVRGVVETVLALFFYLLISIMFFGSRLPWTTHYIGGGNDPISFMWFLHWWPFAIAHGLNPFWTRYVWFPHGFDLAWATSVPTLAAIAAPFTILGNATLAFNVISVSAPGLAAWTTFLLARSIVKNTGAALVAGFIYGFSSYELGQLLGHLNLDVTFLVPLIVLLTLLRFREEVSRRTFVLLTALALFLEIGISTEIVATFCTLGAIVWAIFWYFTPDRERTALWQLALEFLGAACIAAFLSLPFIYYLIVGADTVPKEINSVTYYSADPLNFVLPTYMTWLGHRAAAPIVRHMTANLSEQGAYLGLPLIAILIAYLWRGELTRYKKALFISILLLTVASLGPKLHLDGLNTGIPLPWAVTSWLPLIKSALPIRFTQYVFLAAGIAVACWITEAKAASRLVRLVLAFLACVFLVPNPKAFGWTNFPLAPALPSNIAASALRKPANIIVLPFANHGPGMAWQLDTRMGFTQTGGYVGFTPRQAWRWPVVHDFMDGAPHGNFENDILAFCGTHRVDYILLAPQTPKPLAQAIMALGWPIIRHDGTGIVEVPPRRKLRYFYVQGDYWPSAHSRFSWIGRYARIATSGRSLRLIIKGSERPASLRPVRLTVKIGKKTTVYEVSDATRIVLTLKSGSTTTLKAAKIFRPVDVIHNKDYRHLSVTIALEALPHNPA